MESMGEHSDFTLQLLVGCAVVIQALIVYIWHRQQIQMDAQEKRVKSIEEELLLLRNDYDHCCGERAPGMHRRDGEEQPHCHRRIQDDN